MVAACALAAYAARRRSPIQARKSRTEAKAKSVVPFVAAAMGATGVGLALLYTAGPTSFSNRGQIWMAGLQEIKGSEIVGLGVDRWTALQEAGGADSGAYRSMPAGTMPASQGSAATLSGESTSATGTEQPKEKSALWKMFHRD